MKKIFCIVLGLVPLFCLEQAVFGQVDFSLASQFKYLKGSEAGGLDNSWNDIGFDDSSWQVGNAPFRYGDGAGGTLIDDMMNSYTTFYLRSEFECSGIENLTNLQFLVEYDDGFILFINGERVLSQYAPDAFNSLSTATALHESGAAELFNIDAAEVPLINGTNTIAVLGLNENLGSTDFFFDISITGAAIYPDSLGLSYSHSSGYYTAPFTLTMESEDVGETIYYTLDGSNPQDISKAIQGTSPVNISINPANNAGGRGQTPAVVVRTAIGKPGFMPSYPVSKTYIFSNQVLTQSYPVGTWPNSNVNGQWIDYEMDGNVVNDGRYSGQMVNALKDIPSISIVTDNTNLWDPQTGIYVNAWGHGIGWERECNVELINADGSDGFEVNAGLRIRGGWSRHNDYPKHAFRLFFRSQYGDSKLYYPLFDEEGVDEFDKIDLRTAQNYAWSNGDNRNTMVREVFSRDMQRDMNQPYTRSRYYHLYLNGMYWGIFQTQERSEARWASDYLGDNRDDYDVIKVSTTDWDYLVEATDGNTNAWLEIYSKLNYNMSQNANYFALEGRDAYGNRIKGAKVLVDIDNLIDYMITIFYTGNFDAPTSSFGSNNGPNNFYAVYNRKDNSKGFIFLNHDAEHSMMVEQTWPGIGIYENRVNLGDRTDDSQMTVSDFSRFHPQWLHHKLCENAEYRLRFADRAAMHMTGSGALTDAENLKRFNSRVEQIDMAIIAESARWGDIGGGPFTKDDNWIPVIDQVRNEFFPQRLGILENQLKTANLLNNMDAPDLREGGNTFDNGNYELTSSKTVVLENNNSTGTIYYTLNGEDPRKVGGGISDRAIQGGNSKNFNLSASTIITSRVFGNGEWSPVRKVSFFSSSDDYSKLKVTEIHYHPLDFIVGTDTTSGSNFEFIEFKNTGQTALNLSGFVIDSAVYCEFPENSILAPGKFFVAAAKPSKFFDTYGKTASANFKNKLSNGGEEILLLDASDSEVMRFTYSDESPWPQDPDGNGPSLVARELMPQGDAGDPSYWRSSIFIGGSPFADDVQLTSIEPETELFKGVSFSHVYPNPTKGNVHIVVSDNYSISEVDVKLYGLNGSVLYSGKGELNVLNLASLGIEPGLYILRIETDLGIDMHKIVYTAR